MAAVLLSSFSPTILRVLVGLVAVTIMYGGAAAEESLCNTIVDAAVTPCAKQVASDLTGDDDRVSRSGEQKTAVCRVNSTTLVDGAATCEWSSLPKCRQCLKGASDRLIEALCPDRIGAQINFPRCSFRFEIYAWY